VATADVSQPLDETGAESSAKKRKFKFPTAYTILALLIVVIALLTYVIPAGRFEYQDGSPVPGTYQPVESHPQGVADILVAPINGMYGIQGADGQISTYAEGALYGAIGVALFVLMIGGFLGVTMKTGAIDAGIGAAVKRLEKRGTLLIVILMAIFALGGSTYGMAEETLAFYPLIIAALIALGYDALTAVATIMLGAGIGTLASTVNPFATGIASGFAGIPLGDGIVLRVIMLIICTAVGMWFVTRYAKKVKTNPSASRVADMRAANEERFLRRGDEQAGVPELTRQRKIILTVFALAFVIMIWSVIPWADLGITLIPTVGWWFAELAALFLVAGIVIGIIGRLGEEGLVNTFVDGARDLLGVALIVGLARGISVLMNNGLITDTVLNFLANALAGLRQVPFINAVFLSYLPLAFLIPSSSGLATVTMPIMAPLGDLAGVPKSLIVTAYQSASGLLNLFTPTFAVVMGGLAIGRVPIATWWRFVLPLVVILGVIVAILLSLGVVFGAS
jgi:uncharacterized ion transporter superfamily protein YfcC